MLSRLQGEETRIVEKHAMSWTFAPVRARGGTIAAEFVLRINADRLMGWNPCVVLRANGLVLEPLADRHNPRLVNKQLSFRHSNPSWKGGSWFRNGRWVVPYAPDYTSACKGFAPWLAETEVHRFVLDITDLVSDATENRLALRFAANLRARFRKEAFVPDLMVRSVSVIAWPDKPSPLTKHAGTEQDKYIRMRELPTPEYTMRVGSGGEMALAGSGWGTNVASRFSLPGGNSCSLVPGRAQGWQPRVGRSDPTHIKLSCANDWFRLSRRIVKHPRRIDVYDKLENLTSSLLGVKVRHEVGPGGPDNLQADDVYLAGDPSPGVIEKAGGRNPTVFIADHGRGRGIGLVAVDDVFRVQNVQYWEDGRSGIRTDHLALPSGGTRALEWSIYPVASPDYYDFINTVRADWGVNFPIEGGFCTALNCYLTTDADKARAFTGNRSLKLCTAAVWSSLWTAPEDTLAPQVLHHGTGMMNPAHPALYDAVHRMLAKAKQHSPGLSRLLYFHNQISTEPGASDKYSDARVTDEAGKQKHYSSSRFPIFYPTTDNSYGKELLRVGRWILDTFDVDGIYNDELAWSATPITYSAWDGVSVQMDPDSHEVKRKVGFINLLKLGFNKQFARYVLHERGKLLIANTAPETQTMAALHFPRFEESFDWSWAYQTHLYTPVSLGDIWAFAYDECMEDIRERLRRGTLYYYYHLSTPHPTVTSRMFPFTPIEIHSGWMLGKERIITLYSGEYGWMDQNCLAQTYVYDPEGKLVADHPAQTVFTPRGTRVRLDLPPDYVAAIVRTGFEATAQGQVALSRIHGGPEALSLVASGTGTLRLKCSSDAHEQWACSCTPTVPDAPDQDGVLAVPVQRETCITCRRVRSVGAD